MAATADEIEELYRRRYTSYLGALTAITGNAETARDVVQEAFAKALQSRRSFRGEGSLEAWVWRIAFRTALRSRRNGERELTLVDLVEAAPLPPPDPDPDLAEVLSRLAPRRRLVVFLRYFADLSYAEIAALCEISQGTVAATLSQVHTELLHQFPREGATP